MTAQLALAAIFVGACLGVAIGLLIWQLSPARRQFPR
jgi:ABC-type nitrate/sulfonate/bicarbonate transport system permease component